MHYCWAVVSLLICLFFNCAEAAFPVPRLTGPVVDQANVITYPDEQYVTDLVHSLEQAGVAQLAVLTVPSLEGETIEQASIKVADQWKLGTEKKDNGIILLVAVQERSVRIEVGQGLEGDLPDVIAKRIIEEVMIPTIRSSTLSQGIAVGATAIAKRLDPNLQITGEKRIPSGRKAPSSMSFFVALIVLTLLLRFLGRFTPGTHYSRRGTGWISNGGWGGGSGGGGFSGGGGGFSGGGASGRW